MIWAIIVAPFFWSLCFLFRIIFIILGYIMVPIALIFEAYDSRATDKTEINKQNRIYFFTWKIMAPWQNHTDGFYCTNYYDYGFFWTSVHWSCVRNPAGGLRRLKYYTVKIKPDKVQHVGSYNKYLISRYKNKTEPHWWYSWQGLYSSLLIQFKIFGQLRRLWVGHKLDPRDKLGVLPDDYRYEGAAFTTQFKRIL